MMRNKDGKKSGSAFVTYMHKSSGERAIQALQGFCFEGSTRGISVSEALQSGHKKSPQRTRTHESLGGMSVDSNTSKFRRMDSNMSLDRISTRGTLSRMNSGIDSPHKRSMVSQVSPSVFEKAVSPPAGVGGHVDLTRATNQISPSSKILSDAAGKPQHTPPTAVPTPTGADNTDASAAIVI